MKIAFCCTDTKAEPWLAGLRAALPGAQVELWQPGAAPADYAERLRGFLEDRNSALSALMRKAQGALAH